MAVPQLNTGTVANDGTGDPLRDAMIQVNANFAALSATTLGAGAAHIGVHDAGGNLTATNVEAALAELFTAIPTGALAAQDTIVTADIENGAVTFAKVQNAGSAGIVGAEAAGAYTHLTLGANLSIAGGVLSAAGGSGALASLDSVGTAQINDDAVTFAKMQNATGAVILGAVGAGSFQELTLGTNLSLAGSVLNAVGGAGALADLDTVNTAQIDNGAVTFAKVVDATQKALIGAAAVGDFGEVTLSSNFDITGGALILQNVGTSQLSNNAVTLAKLQAAASAGVIGADAAGNMQFLTLGPNITASAGVLDSTGSTDGAAVHVNGAGEIAGVTELLNPPLTFKFIGENPDGATANEKARVSLESILSGSNSSTPLEVKAATDTLSGTPPATSKLIFTDDTQGVEADKVRGMSPADFKLWLESSVNGLAFQPKSDQILRADTGKTLTAGYLTDVYDHGTITTGTVTPAPGTGQENSQKLVNGGAFTLAPPASPCRVVLQVLNNASAGAITTSGFTKVDGAFNTTDTNKFLCRIEKTADYSHLEIIALQ